MKSFALGIVLTATTASFVSAQGLPFTKGPVSQEEFARAIERDDRKILNVSCEMVLAAAHQTFEDANFATCGELASYMRRLIVAPCPRATSGMARVLPGDKIDLVGWRREFREGEMCLFDNQGAQWVASLLCGNFITDKLPVFAVTKEEPLVERPIDKPATTHPPTASEQNFQGRATEPLVLRLSGHSWYSWRRKSGKAFWVATAVGGAACGIWCRYKNTNEIYITITR